MSALGDLTEIASGKFHGRSQNQAMALAILSLQNDTELRLGALEKKARVKVAPWLALACDKPKRETIS